LSVPVAVIPAAGQGTRLYPLTLGTAKELLPLGRYPALVATLLEAEAAGVREIVIVTSKDKAGVRQFVERFPPLRDFHARVGIVEQPEPAGVLDAVARGVAGIKEEGGTGIAVLFPDLVHLPDQTALRRLTAAHAACGAAVFGLRTVERTETLGSTAVVCLQEPLLTPSALAEARASGRPLRIVDVRAKEQCESGFPDGTRGELVTTFGQIQTPAFAQAVQARCRVAPSAPLADAHLLPALRDLASKGELYGVLLPGEILDLGTMPGYLHAATRFLTGTARLRGLP